MYHCHFEDVEHVQMGMTGIVFVTPEAGRDVEPRRVHEVRLQRRRRLDRLQPPLRDPPERDLEEATTTATATSRRSIADRLRPGMVHAQRPQLSGHARPERRLVHDVRDHDEQPELRDGRQQPAELVAHPGERGRPRAAAARKPRLPAARDGAAGAYRCTSSAQDASLLRDGTVDTSYWTNTLYIGPGEARDVLFDAPAFDAEQAVRLGHQGRLQRLLLQEPRLAEALEQRRAPDPGGMMTEVRVYQTALPPRPS